MESHGLGDTMGESGCQEQQGPLEETRQEGQGRGRHKGQRQQSARRPTLLEYEQDLRMNGRQEGCRTPRTISTLQA